MTIRHVIVYSLLVPFVGATRSVLVTPGESDMSTKLLSVALWFGLWFIGLFLGVLLSVIFRRPGAEPYFYLSGQLLIVCVITVFIAWTTFQKKQHEKLFGNIEDNRYFVGLRAISDAPGHDTTYIARAFLTLESKFENPNSFRLFKYTTSRNDTVVDLVTEKIENVYFTYTAEKQELFAKVAVFRNSVKVLQLNERPDLSSEYRIADNKFQQQKYEHLESLRRSLEELPDSTRKRIIKTLKSAYK